MIALGGPDRTLYTFVDGINTSSLTVEELRQGAARLGAALRSETGRPVLVATGWGPEQPVALFGAWNAGAVAVPVYPDMPRDTLAAIAAASGARVLVGPAALAAALGLGHVSPTVEGPALPPTRTAGAAILLYTSGSTGAPKGAVITHAALGDNLAALASHTGRGAHDVVVSWLPHAHVAGLYLRLLPVAVGGRGVLLAPTSFAARPASWVEAISTFRGTVSAAPDFAYALLASTVTDAVVDTLDLTSWQMAVSGGEPVRAATLARFIERFARAGLRPDVIAPYYGLTETLCTAIAHPVPPARLEASRSGLARGRVRAPEAEDDRVELVGNGPPLGATTEVLAVDPELRVPVAAGRVGELWTRGPGVTPGYHGDPDRSEEACRARLAGEPATAPGWFRTGDLGILHAGQVFVTGRLKELLIVRGKNHYPTDIEATVHRATTPLGVRDVAAFRVWDDGEEALGLAVEVDGADEQQVLRTIRREVATRHGLAVAKLYYLPPGTIPRTTTRKIARHRCTDLAEGGGWAAWALTTRRARHAAQVDDPSGLRALRGPALRAALLTRILTLLGPEATPDRAERPLAELGVSSIELATLGAELRGLSGVEPPFAAFFDGTSARGLADRVASAMEGDAPPPVGAPGWRDTIRRVALALPDRLPPLRTRPGAIFLTGATGFLGGWCLAELLAQGATDVRCLVRAPDPAAGLARLRAALPVWDPAWTGRFSAVLGDVTAPNLGLSAQTWDTVADACSVLVHNAANVNFVAPYSALAATNVDPVHALVALAIEGGETRTLHVVSTLAVFNAPERREARRLLETDGRDDPAELYSGYAQTKLAAEAAFRGAGARGVPLGIHRPGLVGGDTRSGRAHVDDFFCRFLKGCIELGRYPDADIDVDLDPVDVVAAGIAAAVLRPVRATTTFHWTLPNRYPLARVFAVLRARGHQMEPEPLRVWLDRVRAALPPENALFAVHPFLLERPVGAEETILELLDGIPHDIDDTHAAAVRAAAGQPAFPLDDAYVHRMAAWLESTGFFPPPVSAQ